MGQSRPPRFGKPTALGVANFPDIGKTEQVIISVMNSGRVPFEFSSKSTVGQGRERDEKRFEFFVPK